MQGERVPEVLGAGWGDKVFVQLQPGNRHILLRVFRLCSLGFVICLALAVGQVVGLRRHGELLLTPLWCSKHWHQHAWDTKRS